MAQRTELTDVEEGLKRDKLTLEPAFNRTQFANYKKYWHNKQERSQPM